MQENTATAVKGTEEERGVSLEVHIDAASPATIEVNTTMNECLPVMIIVSNNPAADSILMKFGMNGSMPNREVINLHDTLLRQAVTVHRENAVYVQTKRSRNPKGPMKQSCYLWS
jgi:hypothetical protein